MYSFVHKSFFSIYLAFKVLMSNRSPGFLKVSHSFFQNKLTEIFRPMLVPDHFQNKSMNGSKIRRHLTQEMAHK